MVPTPCANADCANNAEETASARKLADFFAELIVVMSSMPLATSIWQRKFNSLDGCAVPDKTISFPDSYLIRYL